MGLSHGTPRRCRHKVLPTVGSAHRPMSCRAISDARGTQCLRKLPRWRVPGILEGNERGHCGVHLAYVGSASKLCHYSVHATGTPTLREAGIASSLPFEWYPFSY